MSTPDLEARTGHKRAAAERAVELVQSGMVVGLGTGSTAIFAVRRIGQLLRAGQLHDVVGVPTSSAIALEARRLGIPLALDGTRDIDLTIDGADEVATDLDLIKGGGGALFHEKIVAQASRREVIVVDDAKLSPRLGTHWAVPAEVVPFGWQSQARFLEALGARVTRRSGQDGQPFVSDEGNWILDCAFGPIAAPRELAARLDARTGIVEHGLFIGLATDVIAAGPGGIRHLTRKA
jgi:ribose 5-phosphate isomerase A